MLIPPFSAIPSWEGFEYQGYCALYFTLKQIYDLIKNDHAENINDFKLGLEGEDDFSIIQNDKYLSLHQVKYGDFSLENKDKLCFILSILQYKAKYGSFHISKQKTLPSDFIATTQNLIDERLKELKKEIKAKNEIPKNKYDKYLLIEDITSNKIKGSVYSMIKFVSKQPINRPNLLEAKTAIEKELLCYKNDLSTKIDKDLWGKNEKVFATTREVKSASYKLIENILEVQYPDRKMYLDNCEVKLICDQTYLFIKENVQDSNTKVRKNNCKINFTDIYDKVVFDYKTASYTVDFQYYKLLERIENVFNKYPTSTNNNCDFDKCELCKKCNLYDQIEKIFQLTSEEQKEFLYKLLLKTPYHDLPNDFLVNRLIITLLRKIDGLKLEGSKAILMKSDGKFFRLTLDSSGESYELCEQLNNEIHKVDSDKLLIYETDVLITDQLNEGTFLHDGNKFNIIGERELKDIAQISSDTIEKQKININKPKIMRLIDRIEAEKELNKK